VLLLGDEMNSDKSYIAQRERGIDPDITHASAIIINPLDG